MNDPCGDSHRGFNKQDVPIDSHRVVRSGSLLLTCICRCLFEVVVYWWQLTRAIDAPNGQTDKQRSVGRGEVGHRAAVYAIMLSPGGETPNRDSGEPLA